ncbi:hypothetical protein A3D42_00680 [Candidatus Nomurabacteria bacterium RIFCSPHIGHO2_02_FULL_41_18]|uniref:VRR-NUC domain-containing protein n=1 Tax=Candidatus Nomurabacteria bacterium RIFCSPHIGHO2_02_FULL_41_18 TaxID=1801754 RepID=A0A1F6W784_9BACT|nr:MAG: hypothetical protein A2737_03005 [Candidatus Nomurabacteria bacterium RIFCSPHIGHO2_01_FULL_41_71]OGI77800.1 MAG: hypothetical protein A3D42_00680 [Candidatus Nomurabacteria bacterium RIFCSPHIGHO2_02_FULL_41_18]OGI89933.1 MAG: hypothetical protein A3B01_01670 [Candidatus Nomurabacteria bacterium RIFCSPLOWO2_01_FULL_41_52b]
MLNKNFPQENNLEFLKLYKVEDEIFSLSSGEQISIQKYFLNFNKWGGSPVPNSYGNKAVIDYEGEPLFAELAVLRLFQSNGWDGVWVDSYGRKYRTGLPGVVDPVEIPIKQKELIDSIQKKIGRSGGCWDVFVWKDNTLLFIELKRQKKDVIQDSQREWLEYSLAHGLHFNNFAFIEWDT